MAATTTVPRTPLFSGPDAPGEEGLYKCVHCGFCLQVCPTYLETGLETESPRGRIALMKAVNEGRIGMTPNVCRHWDLCVQCRACEEACPSAVPYGQLIEAAVAQIEKHRRAPLAPRLVASTLIKHILPHQRRLSLLFSALRIYQRSGLQWATRKTRLLRLFSPSLAEVEKSSPSVPATYFKAKGQTIQAEGKKRTRVALLSGCVMPLVNGPQMEAVLRVLTRNGCQVVVPRGQVCCGAIHSHVGDLDMARVMARRNIDVFLASDVDAVVVASSGCGARMKEYPQLLSNDPYLERAKKLSSMVKDFHEFLVSLPLIPPRGRLDYRVTYQDPCHLSHAQRIQDAPRELILSIPGIEFVEMRQPAICCGAGGAYSIRQREFSLKLLDSKMESVEVTEADVLVTANPGCFVQLQNGVQRRGLTMQVRYVTDLLDEAYRAE